MMLGLPVTPKQYTILVINLSYLQWALRCHWLLHNGARIPIPWKAARSFKSTLCPLHMLLLLLIANLRKGVNNRQDIWG